MQLDIRIKINKNLYVRNPEDSVLGKKIVKGGLALINELGIEDFSFKKLATLISTSETSIYRYFTDKYQLVMYLMFWYWSYLEYKIVFNTNNLISAKEKLSSIIKLLVENPQKSELNSEYISVEDVHCLFQMEGRKIYFSRNVTNNSQVFKPYKDLCAHISALIQEYNPKYPNSQVLACTILEMSHSLLFFSQNLPSLTGFPKGKEEQRVINYLKSLLPNSEK